MKKIICKDYETLSRKAADIIVKQVQTKPDSILGLATGSTPIGTYKELIKSFNNGEVDFSKVITFNLDEYYKINKDNEQSYHYFMYHNLFNHINVDFNNIHIPDGNTMNIEQECKDYDLSVQQSGGIDLQILGIGTNGHIGFNEPGDILHMNTHITPLKESTIQDNARFFEKKEDVPTRAITMGIGTIMKAKKILLLISGKNKSEIYTRLFEESISTDVPASLLQLHPNVTVIVDEDAAYKMTS